MSQQVEQLIAYSKRNVPIGYSPRLNILPLPPKGNLHYLFPFYHAFKDETTFKKIYSDKGYYDELSQYFAFAGDYLAAQQYLVKSFDSVDDGSFTSLDNSKAVGDAVSNYQTEYSWNAQATMPEDLFN